MTERLKCPTCTRTIAEREDNRFVIREGSFVRAVIDVGTMNCPHMAYVGLVGTRRIYERCPGRVELLPRVAAFA